MNKISRLSLLVEENEDMKGADSALLYNCAIYMIKIIKYFRMDVR